MFGGNWVGLLAAVGDMLTNAVNKGLQEVTALNRHYKFIRFNLFDANTSDGTRKEQLSSKYVHTVAI